MEKAKLAGVKSTFHPFRISDITTMAASNTYTRVGPYEIVIDPTRRHVTLTVTGFVTVDDFDAFEETLAQSMKRLG